MPPHWYSGESPFWRFIVTDLASSTLTMMDKLASSRSCLFNLNAPSEASGYVPSDSQPIYEEHTDGYPFLNEGNRLIYGFRREYAPNTVETPWTCRFAGRVELLEDASRENDARTHYTAYDPWRWWHNIYFWENEGGSVFSRDFTWRGYTAAQIVTFLLNWCAYGNSSVDGLIFPPGQISVTPPLINTGTLYPLGVAYIKTGFPIDWDPIDAFTGGEDVIDSFTMPKGTSLGEALEMLCNAAYCDIEMLPFWDPINYPGVMCLMNVHNQMGHDRFSAVFSWDMPGRSIVQISDLFSGTERANIINNFNEQGGKPISLLTDEVQDTDSIETYGSYESQHFNPGPATYWGGKELNHFLALSELELRKVGKRTVTVSPMPERSPRPFNDYYLGDRVPIYASSALRESISGVSRVYGIPVEISDNSLEKITQLILASSAWSAAAETFSSTSGGINGQVAIASSLRRRRRTQRSTNIRYNQRVG